MGVEARLAAETARRSLVVGPALVLAAASLRGPEGALAAAIGVAVVAANFLLSGTMLSVAARISLTLYQAAALFGFFLRLGLITAAFLVLVRLVPLDRVVLALSVVGSYLVLISWEAVAVSRRPSGLGGEPA